MKFNEIIKIQQRYKQHPLFKDKANPMDIQGLGSGGAETEAVTSGPSIAAADAAAQSQIAATQLASQAASQQTQAAIQSLMGEYGTALQYAEPSIFTGNQAEAQMNYLLGMPAVSPGAAPTAPTAPTLQSAESDLTQADVNAYITENTENEQYTTGAGTFGAEVYTGGDGGAVGSAQPNNTNAGTPGITSGLVTQAGIGAGASGSVASALGNSTVESDAEAALAEQNLQQNLEPEYQDQLTTYNQANNAYNEEEGIYNQYNALGTATPETISNLVTNLPGYQFNEQQGISAIQNAASASGQLNSGALLQQLNQFGQGLASNYYNTYMSQLQGLAGLGQASTTQAETGATNTGNTTAGLLNDLGTTEANSYLAAGQAQASSYLSPAANQQVIGTGLGSQSTSGSTAGSLLSGLGCLFSYL